MEGHTHKRTYIRKDINTEGHIHGEDIQTIDCSTDCIAV